MDKVYDLDYFISKFEGIPEEKWTTGDFTDGKGRCCAYGHCGMKDLDLLGNNTEANALFNIQLHGTYMIVKVNDDTENKIGFGTTPKQRIVNYLKSLRDV